MLFVPKKTKFKKFQKGKRFNRIQPTLKNLKFGQIGLKILETKWLTSKQLLALYNNLRKRFKKKGKVCVMLYPQLGISKKPIEVRMGKGKGSVNHWVAKAKIGATLCEIITFNLTLATKVLERVKAKLPIKTLIIKRKY
jgi:large subunit ribosomal protein L16